MKYQRIEKVGQRMLQEQSRIEADLHSLVLTTG